MYPGMHEQTLSPGPDFFRLTGPLTFMDTESVNDHVVEIALIHLRAGAAPDTYCCLIDPGARTWSRNPRRARHELGVHGITHAMVKGSPSFGDLASLVALVCRGSTVVAHNASTEKRLLTLEFGRLGRPWNLPHLCTLRLARAIYPDRRGARGYKLGALAADLGVPAVGLHRAAADATCTVLVMWRMLQEAARRGADVAALLRAATESE